MYPLVSNSVIWTTCQLYVEPAQVNSDSFRYLQLSAACDTVLLINMFDSHLQNFKDFRSVDDMLQPDEVIGASRTFSDASYVSETGIQIVLL